MANLNSLILTSADYKVMLVVPGNAAFPILTADSISWTVEREEESIYAVGEENPIGNKRNATKYSGKFSIQVGEMSAILQGDHVGIWKRLSNVLSGSGGDEIVIAIDHHCWYANGLELGKQVVTG